MPQTKNKQTKKPKQIGFDLAFMFLVISVLVMYFWVEGREVCLSWSPNSKNEA